MIVGIGMDLVEISRIEAALARHGERFAERILTEKELRRFRSHAKPAAYLAKRFAAKEAFSKAMATGMRWPVSWRNIGVVNHPSGCPCFDLAPELEALVRERGITGMHVSITDERSMAAAYVILEGRTP
ncbi:MAG: holo-ACP synthase [Burkholderiales bacterium]|nr:holo-ACP synthase [Caldimonas thermodepolymerans]MBX6392781.1 holo-ACP synthase [Burkholderiales bacterium]